jgi:hypothetical protein
MLADDPKELLNELTRIRDTVVAEAAELMRRWEPMLRRDDFRASAENLAHYVPCAVSTSGRRRRRWRPGASLRWPVARAA